MDTVYRVSNARFFSIANEIKTHSKSEHACVQYANQICLVFSVILS